MNLLTRIAGAAVLGMATVTAASAATSTFDFTGSNQGLASSYSFDDNGLGLVVTSYAEHDLGFSVSSKVGKYSNGLGVTHSVLDGDHRLDGQGFDEWLIFSFSQKIDRFDSVSFSYVDGNDDFDLWSNDGSGWSKIIRELSVPTSGNPPTYTFLGDYSGDLFAIGASGHNDEYKIRGLTATITDAAPVPLPAGGLLLLSGVLGFGALRSRMRK